MRDGMHLLGFDIGGTKCAAVLATLDGTGVAIRGRRTFPTAETRTPEATLSRLADLARELMAGQGVDPRAVKSLGISCGGPLDSRRGLILGPPNLPGWDEVPIVAWCEARLGVPTRLQNDANACALAEWRWGAGRGFRHLVFLTFGTGMGAGLILNGRLYVGASDLAGEVGHVRLAEDGPLGYGKAGSFEGFCSGGGMAAALRRQRPGSTLTAQEIFAAGDDALACEVVEETARRLGSGLAILLDVLNPELIILGSIFVRQQARLVPRLEEVLRQEALPLCVQHCRIVPAELGEALGDYATLAVGMEDGS